MTSSGDCCDRGASDALFREQFRLRAGERFQLRSATAADRPFLRTLFAEVQAEAIRRVGGDPTAVLSGPLLTLQFESQAVSYASAHPLAHHYLALRRDCDVAVGRLLIDWTGGSEPTVGIDLSVLPSARTGAVGMHLLRAWTATCDRLTRTARLHVMPDNPARRLYSRLGFVASDLLAFPTPMLRRPRVGVR